MKLEKIELEVTKGNYILCTIDIFASWDVDAFIFDLDGVSVNGDERPDLYPAAEEWIAANIDELRHTAAEIAEDRRQVMAEYGW